MFGHSTFVDLNGELVKNDFNSDIHLTTEPPPSTLDRACTLVILSAFFAFPTTMTPLYPSRLRPQHKKHKDYRHLLGT